MRNPVLVAAAAALLLLPAAASAQASGTIDANAQVLTPLTVTGTDDLDFGNVIPGVNKTVLPADVGAGQFTINGAGVLQVQLDFGTLPGNLISGTDNLPITFGSSSAGYSTASSGGILTFDPSGTYDANLDGGAMDVFIGGTVAPAFNQPQGLYTAVVTLTVGYTGS